MFSVESQVGRLIEVRVWQPAQRGEHESVMGAMRKSAALHAPAVVCFDVREAGVLDSASAKQLMERIHEDGPVVERTAILLPADNAIVTMQVERVLRHREDPNRRTFHSPVALADWLDQVLTPRERVRLTAFLHRSATAGARA